MHKAGIPLWKSSVCMVPNDDRKVTEVCIFLLGFGSLLCCMGSGLGADGLGWEDVYWWQMLNVPSPAQLANVPWC